MSNFTASYHILKALTSLASKKYRPGQVARPMPIRRAPSRKTAEARPIFWAHKVCLVKKKNSFDSQISNQMDKTMKSYNELQILSRAPVYL